MGFVPDPAPQPAATDSSAGGFVPDKTSALSTKAQNIPFKENALGLAKETARVGAKSAIYAATFVPDIATSLVNAVSNKAEKTFGLAHGQEAVMPSSYMVGQLDKVLPAPASKTGKQGEELAATVLSGTKGVGKLGGRVAEDITEAAVKSAGKLVGHAVDAGLTRITTAAAEQAHNAGYAISPSYVGGKISKAIQQAAGGGKVDAVLSEQNQRVTDRLAKTSLGLHPDSTLDEYTLNLLKKENYAKYNKLAGIGELPVDQLYTANLTAAGGRFTERAAGFGGGSRYASVGAEKAHYLAASGNKVTAQEAIDEVRALRENAKGNLKVYDPEKNALGQLQRQIADAIDARLQRRAAALAQPGSAQAAGKSVQGAQGAVQGASQASILPQNVYEEYKAARQNLAKIHTVEDSLGPDGKVVASALAHAQEAGVKLDGGLKTIADTATHFSRSMKYAGKTGEQGVWSPLDFLVGGAGVISHNPKAALLSVARPVARAALGTRTAQRVIVKGAPRSRAAAGVATRGAFTRGSEAAQEDDE
jgi:hypothetical protein